MDRAISLCTVPESLGTEAEIRRHLLDSVGARSEAEYVALMHEKNGNEPAPPCTAVVRGRACAGDCLEFPEGRAMEEYMATNTVRTENLVSIAVCGDQLADFFADHQMSEVAKAVYCEKYLMDSLLRGSATAVNCSSYRIRADCSALY